MSVQNGTQTASEAREVPALLPVRRVCCRPRLPAAAFPLLPFSKSPLKSLPITAEAVAAFTFPELPAPGGKAAALSEEDFMICFTDWQARAPALRAHHTAP